MNELKSERQSPPVRLLLATPRTNATTEIGGEEPTDDSKDSKDIWSENDKQVDKSEQDEGDGDVTGPIEGLVGEHHLLDRSSHLSRVSKILVSHETVLLRQAVQKVKPAKGNLPERARWEP